MGSASSQRAGFRSTRLLRSTRMLGAALGVAGLSLALAVPLSASGAPGAPEVQPQVAAAGTTATETRATSTSAAIRYGWGKTVAGDEFSYKGQPDKRKWSVYNSRGHDGRGLRRSSAWKVDGNVATVTGSTTGVTGGMSSRYSQKYGRWEARMKTNARDAQYHPNILLWPDVASSRCPEVNFAEGTHDTKVVKFFLHYGCKPLQTRGVKTLDMTQWHNYAVSWTPTQITGYVDGVVWFKDTNRSHLPQGKMHAAAQLDWFPNGKRPRTSTMSVAWMRIYKY